MVSTWIESAARGRHGGPVRAGMWATVVVGTHPIEPDQTVWLEIAADEVELGPLPAYWIENKGVNSLWHVPIPPQAVGARLRYRSAARQGDGPMVYSPHQDVMVRPNLPDHTELGEGVAPSPEGLVGNRLMTVRVDGRGATYDIYFPTVGLHLDVRPAQGDLPQSRSHFRTIVGGLAAGRRLDWFTERRAWEVFQCYQGATNLLTTELRWRHGPIRVLTTDFAVMGASLLPKTAGGTESPGQCLKRFRIYNEGSEPITALFGVYVHAEVNGGLGEPQLSWQDADQALLAANRGHGHANRKLARDATVEFAIALDSRGDVWCEPTGPNEAILLRLVALPAEGMATVDLLVSGAFTDWRGDLGTFQHWLRPALAWFRTADLDQIEHETAAQWDAFVEPLPTLHFPRPAYAVALRRVALGAALHADAKWGAVAAGYERGLHAYCWPRDAIALSGAMLRLGHPEIGRGVFEWLNRVRGQNRPYAYWFQKYTIDGWPEWETPAVDQTALIPWGLERYYRQTGDLDFVAALWPVVEQAAAVCSGVSGHPGLRWLDELSLISSAGLWDNRYGAFLYSNACVVAGLRAASRLAQTLARAEAAETWHHLADRIWQTGILTTPDPEQPHSPGLIDPKTGRFLEARRHSTRRNLWSNDPRSLVDRSVGLDIGLLGPVVPLGLMPAAHPVAQKSAEALLRYNVVTHDPNTLVRWVAAEDVDRNLALDSQKYEPSSLATLWMARYLIQLGRETGQAHAWTQALTMLDGILARLGPLGLALRPWGRRPDDNSIFTSSTPGVWGLLTMLADTMLDLAGLDYDAVERRLSLRPVLPPTWPQVGLLLNRPYGEVDYRLERLDGRPAYRLNLRTRLIRPVTLHIDVTCPGLTELGTWLARPTSEPPNFDPSTGRLTWTLELPEGESPCEWSWG